MSSGHLPTPRPSARRHAATQLLAGFGTEWTDGSTIPLCVLSLGESMHLACDPSVVTMVIPLRHRIPSCPGLLDLAEGLGIQLDEDDSFAFDDDAFVRAGAGWQQLELRDGEVEVIVPRPPEVVPVPRACVRRLPGLLSDAMRPDGSAIDGVIGVVHDAPGLCEIVWIVELPRLAMGLLAALSLAE